MNSVNSSFQDRKDNAFSKQSGGCLFIVSAPSGAGKTTLCNAVRRHINDLAYSISYTTRSPRQGEQDGVDYYFVSTDEFENGIQQGRWAEWARVHGHYYGTSAQWIEEALAKGQTILLDIDVEGARQMVARFPHSETIFIMPPSMEELEARLKKRGLDHADTIRIRLENAKGEMAQKEWYKHRLVNDDLPRATEHLIALIQNCRSRTGGSAA